MDERVALLGWRATADRPPWAVRYLGEVPADPADRAEWTRRAGLAAAYREESGYTHDNDAIGPAPERGSSELRASWHAAFAALRMPDADREIFAATDGQLWSWRAAYARDLAWAPPHVAGELREAHLAEDAYRAAAVHAWHRADAATDQDERAQARQEASQFGALAQDVSAYREQLTQVDEARRRWHAATELDRQRALSADNELRRRHPDADLPPLHPDPATPESTQQASGPAAATGHSSANHTASQGVAQLANDAGYASTQPGAGPARSGRHQAVDLQAPGLDIQATLQAARRADAIIAARERNTVRDADSERDDLMRRRQAQAEQDATARRSAVRQDPAPSHHMQDLEREEPELEAGL